MLDYDDLEDLLDPFQLGQAPGEAFLKDLVQWLVGVDAAGVASQQCALLGEPGAGLVQVEVGTDELEKVLGVALIHDGERGAKSQGLVVNAENAVSDRVEGAAPDGPGDLFADDLAGSADHLRGGPASEGQKQDAVGSCTTLNQGSHTRRQGLGLARAGPGDDEQRAREVLGGGSLLRVELAEEVGGRSNRSAHGGRHRSRLHMTASCTAKGRLVRPPTYVIRRMGVKVRCE